VIRVSSYRETTADGVSVAFDCYRKPQRDTAIVICPGFFQSKQTPTFRHLSRAIAQDFDVICMDFRGHGRSGGFFTFSAREQADLDAVLRWARRRYRRVGILGFSLGAATAVNLSSHQGGVQALVAVSAPAAFEDIDFKFWSPEAIRTGMRGLEPGAGCRPGSPWLRKERPIENVGNIPGIPILLIHGTEDPIVSHSHGERLYQVAREPKSLVLIESGGHAEELYRQYPDRFLLLIRDWLKKASLSDGQPAW